MMIVDSAFCPSSESAEEVIIPMNPEVSFILFAGALLAIASACVLLLFIGNEMRTAKSEDEAKNETEQVSAFLSKMEAATLIGASLPQSRVDEQETGHD